jgi:hypothetical protein
MVGDLKDDILSMKKFIVIYHASTDAMEQMKESSPEDSKKGMEAWMVWAKKCGSGLVDLGTPLGNGQKVTESGDSPSEKGVVGYSILQASDMDAAKEMLKNHPHLGWNAGCDIEIHEEMPLPS